MQQGNLLLMRDDQGMKVFSVLIAGMLRSIADSFENRNKKNDIDMMADVDDQRAHHFGIPEDFDELDESF